MYQGETVNIDVITENQGGKVETFQVTCYYDMGVVGLQTVTLTPGQQKTLTFQWNTAGVSHAQHLILATALPYVPDETDPHDNIFYDGEIFVKISGDVNHDGFVNIYDLIVVRDDLGATPENPPSNPDADLNKDGYVNIFDLVIVRDDLGSVH